MKTNFEIVVVSAFGRGNWLAAELAAQGLTVVLLDVTRGFAHWAPEDWEGPFGIFHPEYLSESQITRLHEEDYMDGVPEGFVVWTKDGVLDTAGPLASELLQKWAVAPEQIQYLKKPEGFNLKSLNTQLFSNSWFLHLCHSLALPYFVDNAQAVGDGQPLPVFSPHFVRRSSRRGYEQNLEWVVSRGVQVLDKVEILDSLGVGKNLQGLEVASEWSGILSGENFVWCLTTEETEHLSQTVRQKVMPGGVIKPEWQWQRYRIQIKGNDIHRDIPTHVVCIEDIGLPWAHENLFILQRSVTAEDYDLWLRLPSSQRFHRDYIAKKGDRAVQFLTKRLPGCDVEFKQWPAETTYDSEDLGPSRFPIFSADEIGKSSKRGTWANLFFDSAETWPRLDVTGLFSSQTGIVKSLQDWKVKKEEALKKQKEAQQ